MTQWYIIYTKENCHLCRLALELLQVYGQDYYEMNVDSDVYAKEFMDKNKFKAPYIMLEEDHIGSYLDFKQHIRNKWNNDRTDKEKIKPIKENNYKIPGGNRPTGKESIERNRSNFKLSVGK